MPRGELLPWRWPDHQRDSLPNRILLPTSEHSPCRLPPWILLSHHRAVCPRAMPFLEVLPRVQHDLKWICLQHRLCSWRQRQCSLPRWLLLHGWLHARGLPGSKVLPVQLKRDHTLPSGELLSVCELSANSMPDGRLLPSCGG